MIDLSLAGLLGAVIGIVLRRLVYTPLVSRVERAFRARQAVENPEERPTLALELSLLRRACWRRHHRFCRYRLLARPTHRGLTTHALTTMHALPERIAP